jgi:nucleoside-diphosphate-sugar epimerase
LEEVDKEMKKKILITGAAGFIGSHLSDLFLEKGFLFTGLITLLQEI